MTLWNLPKSEVRSLVLDPKVIVTSLPLRPTDREWDAHYNARVAANVSKRNAK